MSKNRKMNLDEFLSSPGQQILLLHLPNQDKKEVKAIARELIQQLEQALKPTPVSFLIGGSYGKGTYINGRKEVDIVATCLDDEMSLEEFRKNLFEKAESIARRTNQFSSIQLPKKFRRFSRLLKYKGVDFDILAAIPIQDAREFLKFPESKTAEMSASASKFQTQFMKSQPPQCKDFIRYCKKWREFFTWESKPPSSYVTELLCVHAYEIQIKDAGSFDFTEGFKIFLNLIARPEIFKFWTEFYPTRVGLKTRKMRFADEKRVILDPANPTNNVANAVRNWPELEQAAEHTLDRLKALQDQN